MVRAPGRVTSIGSCLERLMSHTAPSTDSNSRPATERVDSHCYEGVRVYRSTSPGPCALLLLGAEFDVDLLLVDAPLAGQARLGPGLMDAPSSTKAYAS